VSEEVEALLRQAQAHRLAGRSGEAAQACEALLAIRPDMPDVWFNLAMMQRQAGRPAAALASYQEALDRRISAPEEVHLNRAAIYSDDLGQAGAAEAELKTALVIAPRCLAAWLNLGNLYECRGEREQARATYRRALDLAPPGAEPLTLARLADAARFIEAGDA
jgi:tetratricopeptide (TPR) repeat protein